MEFQSKLDQLYQDLSQIKLLTKYEMKKVFMCIDAIHDPGTTLYLAVNGIKTEKCYLHFLR